MEEVLGWIIGVVAVIVALVYALGYVLAALYWCVVNAGYLLIAYLDWFFSSSLLPQMPEVIWASWGILAGATIGFWTIAPVYGWHRRGILVWVVPVGALFLAFGRSVGL